MAAPDTAVFEKKRHVRYWLRCLKTYLPAAYTSTDSNRMMLAFFCVAALDLLGVLYDETSESERAGYIDWVYSCQHRSGGFRAFPGLDFGDRRSDGNGHWDPANIAGTFFALATLVVLGDDLERVRRRQCLEWLTKLQCEDGSFGEVLGQGDRIEGGQDARFCLLAALIRWTLRVDDAVSGRDINVDALTAFIMSSKVGGGQSWAEAAC
jgi:prenyltransferase beta subunit